MESSMTADDQEEVLKAEDLGENSTDLADLEDI